MEKVPPFRTGSGSVFVRNTRAWTLGAALLVAAGSRTPASAQFLEWVRQDGGPIVVGGQSVEGAEAVGVDAAGNTFVTGTFVGQATFGVGEPAETVLTSVSNQDVYVAKYDPGGALVWVRSAGGGGSQNFAFGIAVAPNGDSYVTGWLNQFAGTTDFGGGVTLSGPGTFVVKYDDGGTAQWATALAPTGSTAFAIAVDGVGNSFVTGSSQDAIGLSLITVWKLSPAGGVQWARQAVGVYSGQGYGVSADGSGGAYLTGAFEGGSATFGPGEATETTLTAVADGLAKLFVAKYDAAGGFVWARQSADVAAAYGRGTAIATDDLGNSVISGVGTTTLGLGEPNETAVTGAFAASFDPLGYIAWARSVSPPGGGINPWAFGVAHSLRGATYLTGTGGACSCLFMERYDRAGGLTWSRPLARLNGGLELRGTVAIDDAGRASVAGTFSGSVTFVPGEPNETTLTTTDIPHDFDVFVATFNPDTGVFGGLGGPGLGGTGSGGGTIGPNAHRPGVGGAVRERPSAPAAQRAVVRR
ncbi:MAG: hypothetical protein R2745_25480 [Vicinamibacterales bacterium]